MAQRRYDHEKWARQQVREDERQHRANVAAEKAAERDRARAVIAAGKEHTGQLTSEAAATVERLTSILVSGLARPVGLDLTAMLRHDVHPALDLGERASPGWPPAWEDSAPPAPGLFGGMLGGQARRERRLRDAQASFDDAGARYDREESTRQTWLRNARTRHRESRERHAAAVAENNQRIEAIQAGLQARDRESVQAFLNFEEPEPWH